MSYKRRVLEQHPGAFPVPLVVRGRAWVRIETPEGPLAHAESFAEAWRQACWVMDSRSARRGGSGADHVR